MTLIQGKFYRKTITGSPAVRPVKSDLIADEMIVSWLFVILLSIFTNTPTYACALPMRISERRKWREERKESGREEIKCGDWGEREDASDVS